MLLLLEENLENISYILISQRHHRGIMSKPIKFYYDLMSQPARALYIFLKITNIPFEQCPVALRKGKMKFNNFYIFYIYF